MTDISTKKESSKKQLHWISIADMNEEQNNNKNCEKLLKLFTEKLSDFSELPPDHELMRWIDATGV